MQARWARRLHAAVIAVTLVAGVAALAGIHPEGAAAGRSLGRSLVSAPPGTSAAAPAPAAKGPVTAQPGAPRPAHSRLVATDESGGSSHVSVSSGSPSSSSFANKYPAQSAATIDPNVPATNYWALIIGINDYAGSTRDNVGSYQDGRDLRKHLLALGWRSDHMVFIANRDATASRIIQGIRWLASKTNSESVVVFHYSGHEMPKHTTADGDSESRDVALWVADNRLILDGTLGREMGRVDAARMWIDLAVCRAGGFSDSGMISSGRVLTFSSPESELSLEDPGVHHSVFGWYMIMEGMTQGLADANDDGEVTVEEAFRYAQPLVVDRTDGQQHPAMSDHLSGSLYLRPPQPPPPPPPPPSGGGDDCGVVVFCNTSTREQI
jgi:hypothetical protein